MSLHLVDDVLWTVPLDKLGEAFGASLPYMGPRKDSAVVGLRAVCRSGRALANLLMQCIGLKLSGAILNTRCLAAVLFQLPRLLTLQLRGYDEDSQAWLGLFLSLVVSVKVNEPLQIKRVDLGGLVLTPVDCALIPTVFPQLETLHMSWCSITEAALEPLVSCKKLRTLCLFDVCKGSADGLQTLGSLCRLSSLSEIVISVEDTDLVNPWKDSLQPVVVQLALLTQLTRLEASLKSEKYYIDLTPLAALTNLREFGIYTAWDTLEDFEAVCSLASSFHTMPFLNEFFSEYIDGPIWNALASCTSLQKVRMFMLGDAFDCPVAPRHGLLQLPFLMRVEWAMFDYQAPVPLSTLAELLIAAPNAVVEVGTDDKLYTTDCLCMKLGATTVMENTLNIQQLNYAIVNGRLISTSGGFSVAMLVAEGEQVAQEWFQGWPAMGWVRGFCCSQVLPDAITRQLALVFPKGIPIAEVQDWQSMKLLFTEADS